jgi:opacity protein-like surface antigen
MRIGLAFLLLTCLVCCLPSPAISDLMPPGTQELGGSAEVIFPEEGSYVYVGPRFGTVFAAGSELELEAGYSRESNSLTSSRLTFAANFIYNFETTSAPYPFMLIGFGFSRSHLEWEEDRTRYESDDTNGLLNLGAGLRIPLVEPCLLRLELRYAREFASPDVSTTAIRAGLSVLL